MNVRRPLLASAAGLVLLGLGLPAASAHVTVAPSTTEAGAYTVLTFAASHGCDGSPTTSFTISIPETIADAKPTVYDGWDVEKIEEELSEPITTADGVTLTKHVGKVVYTAKTPLEDGYRAAFEIQVQNPDTPGETLAFPTLQTCLEGATDWAELAAEGQDPHDLEAPAPTYTVTEASGGHGAETGETSAAVEAGSSSALGWVGALLGLVGAVLGAVAFQRTRSTARS